MLTARVPIRPLWAQKGCHVSRFISWYKFKDHSECSHPQLGILMHLVRLLFWLEAQVQERQCEAVTLPQLGLPGALSLRVLGLRRKPSKCPDEDTCLGGA